MKIKAFFLFIILNLLFSCHKEKLHSINFYYWKTTVDISKIEEEYFNTLHCNKLYVRFFDVDKYENQFPIPKAVIKDFTQLNLKAEYVPVIFITNRSLQNLSQNNISELAKKINSLISYIYKTNHFQEYTEIQLDCDWTSSTRDNYFYLLKELKSISHKNISCTIRLHQVKFRKKTGIPPVDKGYLMCYATSNPTEESGKNSILDIDLLKDYLSTVRTYPLEFDIALPLFSWGIVKNHMEKIKIINGLTAEELENKKFTKISENRYKVTEDQFLHGLYLNKDFVITIENISPKLLNETKTYLSKKIDKPYNIIYFHLDSIFVKRFKTEELL